VLKYQHIKTRLPPNHVQCDGSTTIGDNPVPRSLAAPPPSGDPRDALREALRAFKALEHVWWQIRPEQQMIRVINHLGHVTGVVEFIEQLGGEVTVASHGVFSDLSIDPAHFAAAAVALRMSFPDLLSGHPDVQRFFDNSAAATPGLLVRLLAARLPEAL
jgi:hypothetical protein